MIKIIGIYKITNPKGAVYIGESKDIEKRWNVDYKYLQCKGQRKLYNSFVKYGVEAHTFEIIKECTIEEIPYYERHYQEFYNVLDKEFGLNLKYTKVGEKKQVYSDETKRKQSESQKRKYAEGYVSNRKGKKVSEETLKKQRESMKKKYSEGYVNPMKGKKRSEETIKKMSEALTGKKHNKEHVRKRVELNKGKKRSEETKRKMSEKAKGRKFSEESKQKKSESMKGKNSKKVINTETNEKYNSLKEMCKILGLNYGTMKNKLNGSKKNNTSFKYL
jgi:group I intron endonuclease